MPEGFAVESPPSEDYGRISDVSSNIQIWRQLKVIYAFSIGCSEIYRGTGASFKS